MKETIRQAAALIKNSRYTMGFTGAGVSVESGIPTFRGADGLWARYDPNCLDLDMFYRNPKKSWITIKEIFYDFFGKSRPNKAHQVMARLEREGLMKSLVTQNIDNLHQEAGSVNVLEFHGTTRSLSCIECRKKTPVDEISLDELPPRCKACEGVLKPDFVFFGEDIPEPARSESFRITPLTDVIIVVGTTGEVMPAAMIPLLVKEYGGHVIEINPEPSLYTNRITDIYLKGKATEMMAAIEAEIFDKP